jgi:hypothetical protein
MMEELQNNPNAAALGWLLEMELVQNPYMLNSIVLNVFRMLKGVKDAEFVIDTNEKKLLIFLELTWWSRRFRAKKVEVQALELLDQVLPGFKKRVVFEKVILEKALKLIGERNQGVKLSGPK